MDLEGCQAYIARTKPSTGGPALHAVIEINPTPSRSPSRSTPSAGQGPRGLLHGIPVLVRQHRHGRPHEHDRFARALAGVGAARTRRRRATAPRAP